jgi:cytidine deaminase
MIAIAQNNVRPLTLARPDFDAATVGCALLAENGAIYEGVCIHLSCGLGFCAEAAAIANMVKDGERRIRKIVAVSSDSILSPCGRCREMMIQVDFSNFDAEVIMSETESIPLSALLPRHWMEK